MFPLENVDVMSKNFYVSPRANKTHYKEQMFAEKRTGWGDFYHTPGRVWNFNESFLCQGLQWMSPDIRKRGTEKPTILSPKQGGMFGLPRHQKRDKKKTLTKRPVTLPPAMPPVICWVPRTWKRGVPVLHNNGWRDPLLNLQDFVGFLETKRYP